MYVKGWFKHVSSHLLIQLLVKLKILLDFAAAPPPPPIVFSQVKLTHISYIDVNQN